MEDIKSQIIKAGYKRKLSFKNGFQKREKWIYKKY